MKRTLQALVLSLALSTAGFSARSQVTTDFTGSLSSATTFDRPRIIGEGSTADEDFYIRQLQPSDLQAGSTSHNYLIQPVTPQVTGVYSIAITSAALTTPGGIPDGDTFLFLYADNFSSTTPLANLLVANDDSRNGADYSYLSRLTDVTLTAGTTYYIIATSFNSGSTGTISFSINGPGEALFPTLPVKWLGFTAARQEKNVEVSWSTATEQNTRQFVVQHSTDGRYWNNLATVAASGNSSTSKHYSYVDRRPVPKANYYRVLQQDEDGRKSYSKVAIVDLSTTGNTMHVYPNPLTGGQLTVSLETASRVELYNIAGVMVLHKFLPAGTHQLSLQQLPKGIYAIRAGGERRAFVIQ